MIVPLNSVLIVVEGPTTSMPKTCLRTCMHGCRLHDTEEISMAPARMTRKFVKRHVRDKCHLCCQLEISFGKLDVCGRCLKLQHLTASSAQYVTSAVPPESLLHKQQVLLKSDRFIPHGVIDLGYKLVKLSHVQEKAVVWDSACSERFDDLHQICLLKRFALLKRTGISISQRTCEIDVHVHAVLFEQLASQFG